MLVLTTLSACLTVATAGDPWKHHSGSQGHGQIQLTVSTTSGHVHGRIDPEFPNVRQFLGIPFARPPVKDLRWAAPQPLSQPDAQIEATKLPPSCNQFLSSSLTIYTNDVLQFNLQGLNKTGPTSEDCLTVSIWTPASQPRACGPPKEKKVEGLPVLIHIYGGGFLTGGQGVPYQIPAQWINRTPEHIVVTFNYRVNIFGFPGALGLRDHNLGLLDQRAAIVWLKENIAAFGGDPDQMIIFGQSAGAVSVDYYGYAYPSDPIVKGLIMESGTAFLTLLGDPTGTNFTYVATQLGYTGSATDSRSILSYMRSLPAYRIETFVANYSDSGASPSLNFRPIPDNRSVFANYTERALVGHLAHIPAIIGTNAQDGVPFAPYSLKGPSTSFVDTLTLLGFICPATKEIQLRQEAGRLTYSYRYAGNFTNISPRPWQGAYHSSELPLLFGTHPNYRGKSTELEYETSWAMQDAWVAFAKDPKHGLKSQGWEPYDKLGSKKVREFGAGVAAKDVSVAAFEKKCIGAVSASA
ncbi:hypothetical protein DOTSEDRAFT_179278 [Dothistroma septosporum NZE10]|uniref:Carboxylic ester hydrolase n=1 Tax=Dothistroma septosporum (strain NZE10 / CBS 128990) TaxID=675120 RepID=N1PG49_DOTSN|nr:hypothetical protein DOTSEDRAFT_179278 [Dothistroma septosporum NZE10]